MPKNSKDFGATLNVGVTLELKQQLTAMGYYQGGKGEYASPVRNLLKRGFDAWYRGLPDADRKEFDTILANTKIIVVK